MEKYKKYLFDGDSAITLRTAQNYNLEQDAADEQISEQQVNQFLYFKKYFQYIKVYQLIQTW